MNTHDSRVTVVVAPRERFSVAEISLESILADRSTPFELVYVVGGAPRKLQRRLRRAVAEDGIRLVSRAHYLAPNRARNLGWAEAKTDYVVFVDNDVVVSPGWLGPLVACADETGAALVSPLICEGRPLHQTVHCAGGECDFRPARRRNETGLHVRDHIHGQGLPVDALGPGLRRSRIGIAEYHCVLVRTDFLREIGGLDNEMLSTREHLDLCLEAKTRGREIWLEPGSVVTYLYDGTMRLSDVYYYMLRWSDDWERRSLERFNRKWGLGDGGSNGYRLRHLGTRRFVRLVQPRLQSVAKRLPARFGRSLEAIVAGGERRFNAAIASVNRWRETAGM